jgi:uroporphyrinogen decarboxylase
MNKRDVVRCVLEGKRPPYVPWSFGFTHEAAEKLGPVLGGNVWSCVGNHILSLWDGRGFEPLDDHRVRDVFGVVWDRRVDKDIGVVESPLLPEPTLDGYTFPDPAAPAVFARAEDTLAAEPDGLRVWDIHFSLYERAWTLRGMENLLCDFHENPEFVRELLDTIADYNITQLRAACRRFDLDAVHFGDDWGQQKGLQMSPRTWRTFVRPVLARMYQAVRDEGCFVTIHSCGDVDELFDDLVEMGVGCFNPFQPEVMDVFELLRRYRGRLAFHGGLSTQRTLPFGTPDEVRAASQALLAAGACGGYVFAPAHAVEGDVSPENMLAFIEAAHDQPGYRAS